MRREEISEALSGIDSQYVLEAETYSWKKRRRTRLWRGGVAAAALLCLVILAQTLLPRQAGGIFTVKTYALDLDENGTVVLREEDLLEKSDYWGGYCDGENYYINLGFRYEGESIENVTFSAEEGFFAWQRISPGMSEEDVSAIYAGPENQLLVFGEDFEVCGSSVTLEGTEMEEGLLLFWGVEALSPDDIPKNPRITAEATFQDGSTQIVDIHLNLSGASVFGGDMQTDDRDGMPVAYHQSQYYKKLSLEVCELVDEQTVTDLYECMVNDYTLSIQVPEREAFDEDGQYRVRRQRISGAFYLPVFQLEGDACVARLYRVPEELEYSLENEARQQAEAAGTLAPDAALSEEPPGEEGQTAGSSERQEAEPSAAETIPKPLVPEPSAGETASEPQEAGNGGMRVHTGTVSEAERLKDLARFDYYCTLPMSELELVHEELVTDMFSYRMGLVENFFPIQEDLPFNEDGYYVRGVHNEDGDTFVAAIYRDETGGLWGQIYRVPEALVYENLPSQ